jgi:hypothetical protein
MKPATMFPRVLVPAVLACLIAGAVPGFAQTNPAAQSLPVSQNFGAATFTTMPTGFAAWNGINGGSVTSQALAEASAPVSNATIGTATAAQTGGGSYGYSVSSNARPYIQTSSNATNGVNQIAMALNTTGWENVVVGYDVEIISAQPRTVGVVSQYRVGTSGGWTTLTPTSGTNPYSQAGGTAGVKTTVSATLPAAANNQSVVQVRWATWRGTESGNSSGIAIDNVTATGAPFSDNTPPTITTYTPANNAAGVLVSTNLVAQFSETIVKNSGNITVRLVSDNSPVFTIPVTDAAVSVSTNTATITLPSSLAGLTGYYVNIAPGAFEDLAGNDFAGIADSETWTFTTAVVDNTPPAISTLTPADNSSTSAATANLVITYDEAVVANSGSLTIRLFADNSTVETIPVPGALVSISGATVTVNPSSVLQYGTGYYVEIAAGTFRDASNNPTAAVSGNAAWNFTTRNLPAVVISQYYEGLASADRYVELRNLTANPLPLTGYRLAVWSDTPPSDNEGWKSGTNTTDRVTDLSAHTIPANGHLLIVEPNPTTPAYAANNFDLSTDPVNASATDFNGDDSVVLYNGPGFTQAEIVDALSFTANQAADISVNRISNTLQGYDLNPGTSFLNFASTWETRTLAQVNTATIADSWYLQASQPPKLLTLSIAPSTFAESAGASAATATLTRGGDPNVPLTVNVVSSEPSQAAVPATVSFISGETSIQFPISAQDDPWIDGDRVVTITVSAATFSPDSEQVTVLDDVTDSPLPVVINEVDVDQVGTDSAEFVELYNKSNQPVSMDGTVLVFFNGAPLSNASYLAVNLSGTIPANGFMVVGNAGVPNVSFTFGNNLLQNGEDGVALYFGSTATIPTGTLVTAVTGVLVDALVYGTNDPDATTLINQLTPGKPQVNEGGTPASETVSMSRVPDGGAAFDTTLFVTQAPTPGARNSLLYDDWADDNASGQTAELDFDNDGVPNGVEFFMGASPGFTENPGLLGPTVTWPNGGGFPPSAYGTKFKVQTSANLAVWTDVQANDPNLSNSSGFLSYSAFGPAPFFVRLVVTP